MWHDATRTGSNRLWRGTILGLALWAAASPSIALAHDGAPPAPHDAWRAWNLDPLIVLGLGLSSWLYGRGVGELWRRAGHGRGVRRWQVVMFYGGLAALAIALISPLDPLSESLFAFHMAQHLLLTLVAAPLLILGGTLPWLWGLPATMRHRVVRVARHGPVHRAIGVLTLPAMAVALHAAVLWTWHLPRLYEVALASAAVHALEHTGFLGTGLLLWWAVLRSEAHREWRHAVAILALFASALQGGALGALLTFARTPWYPVYFESVAAWGLTPLQDQQLAGTLMWVLPGFVYFGSALALLAAWLGGMDRASDPATKPPVTTVERAGWMVR